MLFLFKAQQEAHNSVMKLLLESFLTSAHPPLMYIHVGQAKE